MSLLEEQKETRKCYPASTCTVSTSYFLPWCVFLHSVQHLLWQYIIHLFSLLYAHYQKSFQVRYWIWGLRIENTNCGLIKIGDIQRNGLGKVCRNRREWAEKIPLGNRIFKGVLKEEKTARHTEAAGEAQLCDTMAAREIESFRE